jgi:hypothetical protein
MLGGKDAQTGRKSLARWARLGYDQGVEKAAENSRASAAKDNEAVRVRRLREDAKRPMSVNLAEVIAWSHAVMRSAGSALRR